MAVMASDLLKRLEQAQQKWQERQKEKGADSTTKKPATTATQTQTRQTSGGKKKERFGDKIVPLKQHESAAPSVFVRSSLFSARHFRRKRRVLWGHEVYAAGDVTIKFFGQELDQGDFDLLLVLVKLAKEQNPEFEHDESAEQPDDRIHVRVVFTSYQALKTLGLRDNGQNREMLEERIGRLNRANFEIRTKNYVFMSGIINSAFGDRRGDGPWAVQLSMPLAEMLVPGEATKIDMRVRKRLGRKQLAKWLHAFYSSHREPYPIRVETLHRLSGTGGTLKDFKRKLKTALDDVVLACAAEGTKASWSMSEEGLVSWKWK